MGGFAVSRASKSCLIGKKAPLRITCSANVTALTRAVSLSLSGLSLSPLFRRPTDRNDRLAAFAAPLARAFGRDKKTIIA